MRFNHLINLIESHDADILAGMEEYEEMTEPVVCYGYNIEGKYLSGGGHWDIMSVKSFYPFLFSKILADLKAQNYSITRNNAIGLSIIVKGPQRADRDYVRTIIASYVKNFVK